MGEGLFYFVVNIAVVAVHYRLCVVVFLLLWYSCLGGEEGG